jgi:hypothetical protein
LLSRNEYNDFYILVSISRLERLNGLFILHFLGLVQFRNNLKKELFSNIIDVVYKIYIRILKKSIRQNEGEREINTHNLMIINEIGDLWRTLYFLQVWPK